MSYQAYKEMVQEYFPLACDGVVEIVKGIKLDLVNKIEEDVSKNLTIDIYDFQLNKGRVAGAFIKRALGVSLYQGDKFIKFLPVNMAWVGCYGKMEVLSNVPLDNPLLKNGIWFIYDEKKKKVIPVFPERNPKGEYEELSNNHLEDLLTMVFNS